MPYLIFLSFTLNLGGCSYSKKILIKKLSDLAGSFCAFILYVIEFF